LKARSLGTESAGFAFWYVNENATDAQAPVVFNHAQDQQEMIDTSWFEQVRMAGFDFFGYRSAFDGLGVFFDASTDSPQPSVTALVNSKDKRITSLPKDCPSCLKFDWRTDSEVVVKVRIQPTSVKVEVVGGGSTEVPTGLAVKAGGYIGFSFQSGDPSAGIHPDKKSTYVELKGLKVTNYDSSASGEDAHELRASSIRNEKADVLAGASSFRDHRAESAAIKDLTNMVFKLVVESQPQRQQMARAVEALAERVRGMEANFKDLKAELDKKLGHSLGVEFEKIKQELFALSKFTSKETDDRRKRLDVLHADVSNTHKTVQSSENLDKHIDKLTDSNSKVLSQLTSEHRSMFGVSFMGIVFIFVGGISLYHKFRSWEKKHVL